MADTIVPQAIVAATEDAVQPPLAAQTHEQLVFQATEALADSQITDTAPVAEEAASHPVIAADQEPSANEAALPVSTPESGAEPVLAGFLSYKKASGPFPIYHKRYFFFADQPVPIDRLHAFYDKYVKNKQLNKNELNQLVAHAATSGKGLFFFSKTPETVPSGILECGRMVDVKADDHLPDKFHISYGGKQGFSFEAKATDRDAWIATIHAKKAEGAVEVEKIKSSAHYASVLKALEEGTAFDKVKVPEGANDVLSEDEDVTAAPVDAAAVEEKAEKAEKPKNTRRTSAFLTAWKDKLPIDKAATEPAQPPVTTPKKEKRKSFLATFLSLKDSPVAKENHREAADGEVPAQVVEPSEAVTSAPASGADDSVQVAPEVVATSAENKIVASEGPKSPMKEKVDGFISKFFTKKHDREVKEGTAVPSESVPQVAATPSDSAVVEEVTTVVQQAIQQTAPELAGSSAPIVSSVVALIPNASSEATQIESQEIAANLSESKEVPVEGQADPKSPKLISSATDRKGLARKLTSLFKGGKKPSKVVGADQGTESEQIASPGPPKLPETAQVHDVEASSPDVTLGSSPEAVATEDLSAVEATLEPAIIAETKETLGSESVPKDAAA